MSQNKSTLTPINEKVLSVIKKCKEGIRSGELATVLGYSFGGVTHHLLILKKAGRIIRNKKTLAWSVK